MTPIIALSIVGSIASIVSLLIAAPNVKSRVVHVVYALLLTVVAGLAVLNSKQQSIQFDKSETEKSKLEQKVIELTSLKIEARKMLESRGYYSTTDNGSNRGFFPAGMGFLERNKEVFPELYETSKELGRGIGITQSSGDLTDFDEGRRLKDGAAAMRSILEGIAGPE